jgi:hypothetical protein
MIPSPMLILAVVIAFVVNGFYWNAHGSNAADTRWTAKIEKERADAATAARATEQRWQGVVNETSKHYLTRIAQQRRTLDTALDSLRDRPERPAADAQPAKTDCPCGTGAGLCRQDGEFLTREAARANEIRAGLDACYQVIDGTR